MCTPAPSLEKGPNMHGDRVEAAISERVAALPGMDRARLCVLWKENFGDSPPPHLRKELMVPILAYRIQEREYGGLSHAARKRLKEIAQSLESRKRSRPDSSPTMDTGSRLIRSWHGEVYEVSVTAAGFEYRGRQYSSLSRIAGEITGTRWSGPLFFGAKKAVK